MQIWAVAPILVDWYYPMAMQREREIERERGTTQYIAESHATGAPFYHVSGNTDETCVWIVLHVLQYPTPQYDRTMLFNTIKYY